MKRRAWFLSVLLGLLAGLAPVPALALGHPETLADTRALGRLDGNSVIFDVSFPIDYLGISWTTGPEPTVRFRNAGRWGDWQEVHEEDIPSLQSRTYSSLLAADDAQAFQVRGSNDDVRAVAINTTDGPRSPTLVPRKAGASHLVQPELLSRAQWGADESYRFNADGTEKWPPAFYATQKLIVHHTATKNNDSDPAATVRAIYRYHAIDQGWGDIGYNFLVDAQGRIYKGRYSGPPGTRTSDTSTGEDGEGRGVTAGHTLGYNSGTMGIAVLGTYRSRGISTAARTSFVSHLAWEAERHGIDPLASSLYVNPVNGSQKSNPNISGHRDWISTDCPGTGFYNQLPSIRQEVAAKLTGS